MLKERTIPRLLMGLTCCTMVVLVGACAPDSTGPVPRDDSDSGALIDASPTRDAALPGDAGQADAGLPSAPRGLYTWNFGGVESLEIDAAVALLRSAGYAGIVVDTRAGSGLLQKYLTVSKQTDGFRVVAAYVAVQLNRGEEFTAVRHKAAIDLLAEAAEGDLWITFRDDHGTQTRQALRNLVADIVRYAADKSVRIVLYPHNNNVYPTTAAAMELVNEINSANFGVALNLTHELRAGNSDDDALRAAFEAAGDKLFAITLAGASDDLTGIMPLHESAYDLMPFIRLIKESGFRDQVGFLNFDLSEPQTYLPLSMNYWQTQSEAVGLRDLGPFP